MRPAFVAFGVAAVVGFGGGALNGAAPDLFKSLGGWVTVVVILVVACLVGSFMSIRRMRIRSAMPDDSSESSRD